MDTKPLNQSTFLSKLFFRVSGQPSFYRQSRDRNWTNIILGITSFYDNNTNIRITAYHPVLAQIKVLLKTYFTW